MHRSASEHPIVAVYHADPNAYLDRIAWVLGPDQLRVCRDPYTPEAAAAAEVVLCFTFAGLPREIVFRLRKIGWIQQASGERITSIRSTLCSQPLRNVVNPALGY